jgi:membrane protein involved in colicin uptake
MQTKLPKTFWAAFSLLGGLMLCPLSAGADEYHCPYPPSLGVYYDRVFDEDHWRKREEQERKAWEKMRKREHRARTTAEERWRKREEQERKAWEKMRKREHQARAEAEERWRKREEQERKAWEKMRKREHQARTAAEDY